MKRLVLVGCILSFVLLLTVPCIPAVESNQIIQSNRVRILKELRSMDIDELKDKIEEINDDGLNGKLGNTWVPTILLTLIGYVNDLIDKYHNIFFFELLLNLLGFILYVGFSLGFFTEF